MTVAIRHARPEDAAALARLAKETFVDAFVRGFALDYPEDDLEQFLRDSYAPARVAAWIGDPTMQVLLAEDDGGLLAYAQAGDNTLPYAGAVPGDGELKRIYVASAAQGAGLGRALLERSLDWLGKRPVFIGVWSGNHKAQRLYRLYGFEIVGTYRFAVGNTFDDEVIMGRP